MNNTNADQRHVCAGGSGRASLSRLAAYVEGMPVLQIALSKGYGLPEWRDDLKRFCRMCALIAAMLLAALCPWSCPLMSAAFGCQNACAAVAWLRLQSAQDMRRGAASGFDVSKVASLSLCMVDDAGR